MGTLYTPNHVYHDGSLLLDSGWFAALALPNPPSILTGSFDAVHIAPIFAVLGLIRQTV